MKKYTVNQALSKLKNVTINNKTIVVETSLGLGEWSLVDFLVNHCGYNLFIKNKKVTL